MPNNYGANIRNKKVLEIEPIVAANAQKAQEIQDLGGAYIVMACGLWYEWSLAAGEEWFGFDIKNRKVTFTDDGLTKIWTSTWEQCGRGLAALLSLPVHKDKAGSNGLALEQFKNDQIILESFRVNQRDMLDSLHRVLGTTDADWDIRSEPRQKRLEDGQRDMMNGDVAAFAKQLYAKLMRPEAQELEVEGIEKKLGLPKESLDEATKRAVDMAEGDWTPFG
ncbi:uncharacterized protein EI97DRAFT_434338 [Westerdykella ornata]|uniref:NmrA-like domain-containing protein n=1 Tax=Westerdykella ornata TaxID=318751 RepID=A0A6A6JGW8_WESOR|nr:uncharacterized protein EI97DRAFT_434338 [Westerdykella ornata]KAF2275505.1 hypothetical protein EI97DRAFT_434338 [Westerdykella ornata]